MEGVLEGNLDACQRHRRSLPYRQQCRSHVCNFLVQKDKSERKGGGFWRHGGAAGSGTQPEWFSLFWRFGRMAEG